MHQLELKCRPLHHFVYSMDLGFKLTLAYILLKYNHQLLE